MSQSKNHKEPHHEREHARYIAFHKNASVTEKTSEPNQFACDNTTIGTNFGANHGNKSSTQNAMIQNLLSYQKN